jgi:hypothetical protein
MSAANLGAAFDGPVPPGQAALVFVTTAMVLLPLVYVALIGAATGSRIRCVPS